MVSNENPDIWFDLNWDDGQAVPVTPVAETMPEHRYQPSLKKRLKKLIVFAGAATVATVALGSAGELIRPKSQVPTFAATEINGCYVSDDWQWVRPRESTGMDDLVIHNVKGVTSEGGKGARCLDAASMVIASWANQDDFPLNNLTPRQGFILRDDQVYAVPLFAATKPQG